MAAIDQLKALDEQRAKLVEEAKTGALNRVDKAIADLNGLGFHYVLNDESEKVLQYVHDGPDGTGSMIIDRLKVLDKLRSELLETAKAEALKTAGQAVDFLRELGCPFQLVGPVSIVVTGEEQQERAVSAAPSSDHGKPAKSAPAARVKLAELTSISTLQSDEEYKETDQLAGRPVVDRSPKDREQSPQKEQIAEVNLEAGAEKPEQQMSAANNVSVERTDKSASETGETKADTDPLAGQIAAELLQKNRSSPTPLYTPGFFNRRSGIN